MPETPAEPQALNAEVTTKSGRLLLMAGLTFHSGRRLADHPELVAAIEQESASRDSAGAGLDEELLVAARALLVSLDSIWQWASNDVRRAMGEDRERLRLATAHLPVAEEGVTHGRHCPCSACAREDWTNPGLAACGMHGPSCPAEYASVASATPLASPEPPGA